ncbi:MAG: nucleotide sugar dehydrogenase [Oscillospiraceae bacterium]|jgi:UDP-N-acetyl-D-galactosamine dehydrogenase|nr:nucleotide sugar dehydrogenase [Oscillospiraceae bacterium]
MKNKPVIAVVGLGYVGMPLAVAFSKVTEVIGFDINEKKVEQYNKGIDVTNEVGDEAIKACTVNFTSNPEEISKASFIIIAVPTPVDEYKIPDLRPVWGSSEIVGKYMSKGSIVVYESTVYPGVTEDECVPILEKQSGLKCGVDFKVGYSPERINPGDKVHRLETITKIVSGMDAESLDTIAQVYELVIEAGVHRAAAIKVAEAAKVIENSQRDINIAFVNELSKIFELMDIDTYAVLDAAGTKWNFLKFNPGLVGGHCIGVDPYYLTYKAQKYGYNPEIILAGRRMNDSMGRHTAECIIKQMIKDDCKIKGAEVAVLGVTFKEDVPDVRNSKIADVVHALLDYGVSVTVVDPNAAAWEVEHEYGFKLSAELKKADAVVVAVSHKEYRELKPADVRSYLKDGHNVLCDIKGIIDKDAAEAEGLLYWRL